WHGDAVDIALLALGHKLGRQHELSTEEFPQVGAIPFESEHQYAATFHQVGTETLAMVKGSPERVLALCGNSDDPEWVASWEAVTQDMAQRGFRVLALAEGPA